MGRSAVTVGTRVLVYDGTGMHGCEGEVGLILPDGMLWLRMIGPDDEPNGAYWLASPFEVVRQE